MDQNLEIAIKASVEAGKKIMEIYSLPDFGIEEKADLSPLTLADKAAHDIIVQLLGNQLPILSEEGKNIEWETRKNWNKFWLVDPLDGTKEFIKRNGEFTVNIALIEKGKPLLGVVFVPVKNELYYASQEGSFLITLKNNEEFTPEQISKNATKLPFETRRKQYVVVGSRSHLSPETEAYIHQIDTGGKPVELISKGSSLKLCMVATGEADIYPRLGPTMEWDTAAGHAIALYAGRRVTQYPGEEPLLYNKENLLNPYFIVK
jgi:3'(2'), 5'-bisphosphate nucleotidase